MAITTTWTDPSEAGTLDLATGNVLTAATWEAVMSNLLNMGGTTGHTLTTWTPVIDQAGVRTQTIHLAKYVRRGPTIWLHLDTIITAAGSAGTGISVQGLPVNVGEYAQGACLGTFHYERTAGTHYAGAVVVNTADASQLWLLSDAATGALGANPSFATANGDKLSLTIEYIPA